MGLGMLAVWRRPAGQLSVSQWSTEIASVSLGLSLFPRHLGLPSHRRSPGLVAGLGGSAAAQSSFGASIWAGSPPCVCWVFNWRGNLARCTGPCCFGRLAVLDVTAATGTPILAKSCHLQNRGNPATLPAVVAGLRPSRHPGAKVSPIAGNPREGLGRVERSTNWKNRHDEATTGMDSTACSTPVSPIRPRLASAAR